MKQENRSVRAGIPAPQGREDVNARDRRQGERAERRRLIVDTARRLAETHGWDAVTIRRLAERIEYSQPVLYSHFSGKDAIVAAVAEEGFAELATAVRLARRDAGTAPAAAAAAADAYARFAADHSALYDAMFVLHTEPAFGPAATGSLGTVFAELMATLPPGPELEARTEVAWSALHGLAMLERGGSLRPDHHDRRLAILLRQWGAVTSV